MSSSYLLQGPRHGKIDRSREGKGDRERERKKVSNQFHTKSGLTIADILDVSFHFLQTVINVVEGSESDIPLDLSPRRQLVDGSLRTLDLGWLHCGRSCKLIFLLTGMLEKRRTSG